MPHAGHPPTASPPCERSGSPDNLGTRPHIRALPRVYREKAPRQGAPMTTIFEGAPPALQPDHPEEAAAHSRLHARLETDAAASDLLDVAYPTVDSPVGARLLAATRDGPWRL